MRVLIVEDEHKIANSLKVGLEQENLTVDVAYTGTDGLDLAMSEEYDVIILDRMLPGIEGVEIVRKMRNASIHTPVLLLTAKSQLEDKVDGLDSGADDYLTKPFAFSELLARTRALMRRPKQSLSSVLVSADLSLNPTTFEVLRKRKNITLSQKEFSLLEYLMRHKEKIITKDQIINHVWNYDSDVLPNSVEVYIKHLRDKIDKGSNKKLIHTVRGFGYKISERD